MISRDTSPHLHPISSSRPGWPSLSFICMFSCLCLFSQTLWAFHLYLNRCPSVPPRTSVLNSVFTIVLSLLCCSMLLFVLACPSQVFYLFVCLSLSSCASVVNVFAVALDLLFFPSVAPTSHWYCTSSCLPYPK